MCPAFSSMPPLDACRSVFPANRRRTRIKQSACVVCTRSQMHVATPLYKTQPSEPSLPDASVIQAADDTMRTQWVLPAIRRLAAAGWTRVNVEVADGADHGTSDELENHWMDSFLAQFFASL
ncbi:rsmF [Symbiodinium sp. CCMP2456]|nr:rsmF [Symbiodinium sp. CCMP2456]